MSGTIVFKGDLPDLTRALAGLPVQLTRDQTIGRGLALRIGVALLSKIQQAFLQKARGGTGEDGIKWAPLAPETVARRRLGPADRKAIKGKKGKARKAILAGRQVEILRDTGLLFRSLSPGLTSRAVTTAPPVGPLVPPSTGVPVTTPPVVPGQVFVVQPGRVTVGTNVKPWHHRGVPGKLPARPLWPKDGTIPKAWWPALLAAATRGVVAAIALEARRVAG